MFYKSNVFYQSQVGAIIVSTVIEAETSNPIDYEPSFYAAPLFQNIGSQRLESWQQKSICTSCLEPEPQLLAFKTTCKTAES